MAEANCMTRRQKLQDETGAVFGELTVLAYIGKRGGAHYWRCQCSCGNEVEISNSNLHATKWRRKSCMKCKGTKHGMCESAEYMCHKNAKGRCTNTRDAWYPKYGGRGIRMCANWLDSFENFFADMGFKPFPKASLDRINNDGHYSCGHCPECIANDWPMNCRWASPEEQSGNTRVAKRLTYNGKTQSVRRWSRELGIHHNTIFGRLKKGWSVEETLTIPPGEKR